MSRSGWWWGVVACAAGALGPAGCVPAVPVTAPAREVATQEVSYTSARERVRGFLARRAEPLPGPGVVMVHGDFGLTRWVKDQAERLARRGFVVLAVDLYHGEAPKDVLEAHIMDRGLADDRVQSSLKAAVDLLVARPDVRANSLGIIGFDSGGGNALDAAIHDPRLRAVVTCYGRLTTDAALLAPLNAAVLGIFAGKDLGIPADTIERFRRALARADKRPPRIIVYPECGHGFLDPTGPSGTEPAAAKAAVEAWTEIEAFLAAELRP